MTHPAFPGDFYQPGDSGYGYPDDGPNDPVPGPDPDLLHPPTLYSSLEREELLCEALRQAKSDIQFALPHTSGAGLSRLSAAARNIERRLRQNTRKREEAEEE